MAVYEVCSDLKLPVLFHCDALRGTDAPGLPGLGRVLAAFPDVPFIGHGPGFWASISGALDAAGLGGYPKGPVVPGGALDRLLRRPSEPLGRPLGRLGRQRHRPRPRLRPGVPGPSRRPAPVRDRLPQGRPGGPPIRAAGRPRLDRRGPRQDRAGECDPFAGSRMTSIPRIVSDGNPCSDFTPDPPADDTPHPAPRAGARPDRLRSGIGAGPEEGTWRRNSPGSRPPSPTRPGDVPDPPGVPPRADRRRAAGHRPGERVLRRRRPDLRRRDARVSVPGRGPQRRVRRLEDTDDDGRFDRGTTFVDGLSWPTSVVPYDGGVFIAVRRTSSMPRTPTATAGPTSRA
jgi:hypothetical protein